MPRSGRGLMGRLLGSRLGRRRRDEKKGEAPCPEDRELEVVPLRLRHEATHGMDERGSWQPLPRVSTKKNWESRSDRRARKMWEKAQEMQSATRMQQVKASMIYAKKQILLAESTQDLLMRAENLIDQDWLGNIDELAGSMYFIGALGDFGHGAADEIGVNLETLKNRARLLGCCVVTVIQLLGPPAVFFSTVLGWGRVQGHNYHWQHWDITDMDNALSDWKHIKLTKALGIVFMLCFILNGLFVVLDGQKSFFQIYKLFQYLKRSTPLFDLHGLRYLFLGAFVDCWTVLWCCISSYVVVGASASPKDILFDSLGLLFVYNLDDIGGELGFVKEDDWPGLRLGWIHSEMVRRDWQPGDEEEPGEDDAVGDEPAAQESYVGGETSDWDVVGWMAYAWYNLTTLLLAFLTVFLPCLSIVTPFLKIVPTE